MARPSPIQAGGRRAYRSWSDPRSKGFCGASHGANTAQPKHSKATNADSTEKALLSFPKNVHWILGGKPKDGGITSLEPYFKGIVKAYLIGAASDEFAATLEGADVPYVRSETLDKAVAAATADAAASGAAEAIVLLSPACASYDQFKNFEVRGDAFRALVAALPGVKLRSAS